MGNVRTNNREWVFKCHKLGNKRQESPNLNMSLAKQTLRSVFMNPQFAKINKRILLNQTVVKYMDWTTT